MVEIEIARNKKHTYLESLMQKKKKNGTEVIFKVIIQEHVPGTNEDLTLHIKRVSTGT